MKTLFLIAISCFLFVTMNAQNGKRFEYQKTQNGGYIVSPTLDQSKGAGKMGQASFSDQQYVNDLIYKNIKQVFSTEKLEKMHLGSGYVIYFNTEGDVINCKFNISPNDVDLITEEDLYDMYIKIKKVKFDKKKVGIIAANYSSNGEVLDYAIIIGAFKPLENRRNTKIKN